MVSEPLQGQRAVLDRITVDAAVGASVVLPDVPGLGTAAPFAVPLLLGPDPFPAHVRQPPGVNTAGLAGTRRHVLGLAAHRQLDAAGGGDPGQFAGQSAFPFGVRVGPLEPELAGRIVHVAEGLLVDVGE